MKVTKQMDDKLKAIAKDVLGMETLDTKNSDDLDFSDQSVWCIRRALEQAFNAGMQVEHDKQLAASKNANIKLNFD